MIIPLRTDRTPRRRPIVTEVIIVANLVVFLFGLIGWQQDWFEIEAFVAWGHFDPQRFRVWQLFTSQFLHDPYSIWHLAFNMLFLWVFGCPVEDRFGRIGYPVFYLLGGAVAGLAHMALNSAPAIGASGAIAAVVGAFLALFPRSRIKVLLIFFIIGVYMIPSLWLIAFYFLVDVLSQTAEILGGAAGDVAYMAHIAGNVFGFAVGFTLLGTRILKHEEFDVFYLFRQARRRAEFRSAVRERMGAVWDTQATDTGDLVASHDRQQKSITAEEQRQFDARAEISRLLAEHRLPEAAAAYRRLLAEVPQTVFPEQRQIDLANQLYQDGYHADAAVAYERFLAKYPAARHAVEVRLILGLLYTRRLDEPGRARELLEKLRPTLRDDEQTALADQLLAELPTP
ncbi:MAG: rhomboid family intramembrane serine protease [Planctomycetota bacterium]|jgi:membrane associated rhomboid family serine protease